ncbi:MAG: NAD-dependent epimerase/dehydratase family protein [Candidatus Didemnitutus sp.]|nr:NAD-dependent epimerase/dehydratase family protein [Candidatus Didemnitutus sp.]
MSTYLVTGAAGFIASKVCEFLLAEGHTVVGVDNLNDYYDVRLKDYRLASLLAQPDWWSRADAAKSQFQGSARSAGCFHFRPVDIEDLPALDALFSEFKFDAVFNLAARAGVRYSMENPYVYLSTNTLGTLNVLECQRKYGVKKQVLASTSSLYAGCAMPFTEELPVNTPLSPYAATKKGAELLAYSYHKLYGLDTTVVRYFTVFGPAGRPDMSVFRFIKWIDEEQPLELFGDGTQSRDFTYVDDIARGTILAAKPLGYEIVNLGGGRNPISLQTVIAFMEKALGKKAVIAGKPFHVADIKETWADITKAGRLLGWSPRILPEEGFQRTVDWYLDNRIWLREVRL